MSTNLIRSPVVWLTAAWFGLAIHLDWHLGRPAHDHLSFGLSYHWLFGVVASAPVAWIVAKRWPESIGRASSIILGLGVLLGQGLEPLGEVLLYEVGWEPFRNTARWQAFGEFLAAALLSYTACIAIVRRRSQAGSGQSASSTS